MKLGVHVELRAPLEEGAARSGRSFDAFDIAVNGFEAAAHEIQDLYLAGKQAEAGEAIPAELIDMVSPCGPRDVIRDRLAAFRGAGVGTLMVTPMAFTADDRIAQLRAVAELAA
jgi:Luciferase-like monooxygenase